MVIYQIQTQHAYENEGLLEMKGVLVSVYIAGMLEFIWFLGNVICTNDQLIVQTH